jgi:TRAP-type C4-dicarboxylate transport system permease small subunit
MVGCVFGIFSVMAILTAKLPQKIRIVVAVIGELIVLITAFVMFKTITTYMMMCVVERAYLVNATRHPIC